MSRFLEGDSDPPAPKADDDNDQYLTMFTGMFNENNAAPGFVSFIVYFMFFYGCYCFLCKVFRVLGLIKVHMFRPCCTSKTKLFDKYGGAGSWALVTGGSDGIGLEMCRNLAEQGFNIVMVSRNQSKMETKIEELKGQVSKTVEYKIVVADFGKLNSYDQYKEIFCTEELKALDIGVVCANAGYAEAGLFVDNTDDYITNSMNINVLHVYYLFKIMADKLWTREKRSAMIVTSSVASVRPQPCAVTYCAQKRFVTHLSQGLGLELAKKVDVLSFNPGEVATKLIFKDKSQVGGMTILVEKAVDCCFRDLGHTDMTHGAFVHVFGAWIICNIPHWMLSAGAKNVKKEEIDKMVDNQKAKFEEAKLARSAKEGKSNTVQ